jgi:heme-degrading monooxygenase HmoA
MVKLAEQQPGFLGVEAARADVGITVSYWADLESIKHWKANSEHLDAQKLVITTGMNVLRFVFQK